MQNQPLYRQSVPPDSHWQASHLMPLLASLRDFFAARGVRAYLVGGVVRDLLIGRHTNDVDVAVEGDAQGVSSQLADALKVRLVPLDEEHGIFRIVLSGYGGRLFVDVNSATGGIEADLRRRDFTIDALAVPLDEAVNGVAPGGVIDLFGGVADLQGRTIRVVSGSALREDPARLMRAARLAAQLGFDIEAQTASQIRQDAHLVVTVAPERVRDEFLKLLEQRGSTSSLRLMDGLGLLCMVIPELEDARGVMQPREHYWDVFNHLVETPGQAERVLLDGGESGDFVTGPVPRFSSIGEHFAREVCGGHSGMTMLKLACLLHDIGKPATRSVEETGRIRFLGHHTVGADMAARILRRLRLGRRGVDLVRAMVRFHLRPGQMAQRGELPSGRAIYRYYRDAGDAAVDILYLNLADYLAARGPGLEKDDWEAHCRVIGHILREGLEQKAPEVLPKLVSGYDIMEAFDMAPGPRLGELLDMVREAQASGEISTKEEALELVGAELGREPGRGRSPGLTQA